MEFTEPFFGPGINGWSESFNHEWTDQSLAATSALDLLANATAAERSHSSLRSKSNQRQNGHSMRETVAGTSRLGERSTEVQSLLDLRDQLFGGLTHVES